MRKWLTLCMLFFLVSCSLKNTGSTTVDVPLQKGKPMVYIFPMTNVSKAQKVGVLPFIVPQYMTQAQGEGVAAMFRDVLLKKRAFRVVKQLTGFYGNVDDAVTQGKKAGVDLVLAGEVHYALGGTELGGARVDVSVRLVSVKSGNTVWYIEQTVDQPVDYPDAGMVSRLLHSVSPPPIRKSQGAPAVPNMLAGIARDMADVMGGADYTGRL